MGIVKGFNVAEHALSGIFQVAEQFVVGPFVLEGPKEAFHDINEQDPQIIDLSGAREDHRSSEDTRLKHEGRAN